MKYVPTGLECIMLQTFESFIFLFSVAPFLNSLWCSCCRHTRHRAAETCYSNTRGQSASNTTQHNLTTHLKERKEEEILNPSFVLGNGITGTRGVKIRGPWERVALDGTCLIWP